MWRVSGGSCHHGTCTCRLCCACSCTTQCDTSYHLSAQLMHSAPRAGQVAEAGQLQAHMAGSVDGNMSQAPRLYALHTASPQNCHALCACWNTKTPPQLRACVRGHVLTHFVQKWSRRRLLAVFCFAIFCASCASYSNRKKALHGDMSRYICCNGDCPCSGRMKESDCPEFCLCLEVWWRLCIRRMYAVCTVSLLDRAACLRMHYRASKIDNDLQVHMCAHTIAKDSHHLRHACTLLNGIPSMVGITCHADSRRLHVMCRHFAALRSPCSPRVGCCRTGLAFRTPSVTLASSSA